MLRIEGLTKTYGEKKAVDELSLHIRPGEYSALTRERSSSTEARL